MHPRVRVNVREFLAGLTVEGIRVSKLPTKAIRIFAPCPVLDEDENGESTQRIFFKTAYVFDVSQTEGKDLTAFAVPEIETTADELLTRLEQVAQQRGIRLEYQSLQPGLYGQSLGGQILLAEGVSSGQRAKTLVHEIAHSWLHFDDEAIARPTAELKAQAVAYVVCRHFGLDVELRASRYITKWGGSGKKVAKSFERISRTVRALIEGVEDNVHPECGNTLGLVLDKTMT